MNTTDDTDDRWVHTVLVRAMGDEPALGLDPGTVLTVARQRRTQRRAALLGISTVVVLVTTGLLLLRPAAHVTVPPATQLHTSAAAPTTVYDVEGPLVIDEHGRELTTLLVNARLIPPGIAVTADEPDTSQPLEFYKLISGSNIDSYYAEATLTDAHGAGHLVVQVLRHPTGQSCASGAANLQPCHTATLADGSQITTMHYVTPGHGKQAVQWIVELIRPDGTAVDVLCGNWSLNTKAPHSGSSDDATGAEPPLGVDTLVALAQLRGLTP